MISPRSLLLIGFPIMFLLLLALLGNLVVTAVAQEREATQRASEAELQDLLNRAEASLRKAWLDAEDRHAADVATARLEARQTLGHAATLLLPAIQALDADYTAARETHAATPPPAQPDNWSQLLGALGLTTPPPPLRPVPPPVIPESPTLVIALQQEALQQLLPGTGVHLSVLDSTGTPLWQSHAAPEEDGGSETIRLDHRLPYHWQGTPTHWRLQCTARVPAAPPAQQRQAACDVLLAEPRLRNLEPGGTALAVFAADGTPCLVLPTPDAADSLSPGDMRNGQWVRLPDSAPDEEWHLQYTRHLQVPADWMILAGTVVQRPPLAQAALAHLRAQPLAAAIPLCALLLSLVVVILGLRRSRGTAARRSRRLVRRGHRSVSEKASILVADFDQDGEADPVQVQSLQALLDDERPRYRESNVLRLREAYEGAAPEAVPALDLEGQVRSDVLRDLLQRVRAKGQQPGPPARED